MRWKGSRQSKNIEDRRGQSSRRRMPRMGGGKFKLGGWGIVAIIVISMIMGKNPLELLMQFQGAGMEMTQEAPASTTQIDPNDEAAAFVSAVLAMTEDFWKEEFRKLGRTYEEPRLVLFRGQVQSACGFQSSAVGPFYCPADKQIYIDLSFFDQLSRQFGAPGDFAQAYVIAHEVGHHVQNLLGISNEVYQQRRRLSEVESNQLSVRQELQADFFAGVWAHYAQKDLGVLERGDYEEALNAAHKIGDDHLQHKSQGHVVPDAFTHGTSEQRKYWFGLGFKTGDIHQGNTFEGEI